MLLLSLLGGLLTKGVSCRTKQYLLLLILLVQESYGHLVLTYPPARQYPLDFSDNYRTRPPCGMPKNQKLYTAHSVKVVSVPTDPFSKNLFLFDRTSDANVHKILTIIALYLSLREGHPIASLLNIKHNRLSYSIKLTVSTSQLKGW
ncbi:hypothetical protein RRG08_019457 [Elysia crispata]|uniref:Secreted protein n=1 Tax=Elysia crispata TaxID=231223 RepID=A0AAE1E0J1_9GAST|nr:hypothetical protein RRG08_019457 [Elysia crispata]